MNFTDETLNIGDTGSLHIQNLTFNGGLITGAQMNLDSATGNFVWNGGVLSVDTINGDVLQLGGVLDPNRATGTTTINGDYTAASAGTVNIEIDAATNFDQLFVNGAVDLNTDLGTGAALTVDLGFAVNLGDSFIFLQNDGVDAISNQFAGLSQGSLLNAVYAGDTYVFEIDYLAGDGNDISLELINIL